MDMVPRASRTEPEEFNRSTKISTQFDERPLTRETVALISNVLDDAGIPSVLWGTWLIKLHGVPTIVSDPQFVVPDDLVGSATKALLANGAHPCARRDSCLMQKDRFYESPADHVHIGSDQGILLFKQSRTLWAMRSLEGLPMPPDLANDQQIILASDDSIPAARIGGGSGPFPPDLHPVRLPTRDRLVEAFILLYLRDWPTRFRGFWMAMLSYVGEYMYCTGLLDLSLLRPHHREFLVNLNDSEIRTTDLVDKLRQDESTCGSSHESQRLLNWVSSSSSSNENEETNGSSQSD